MIALKLWYDGSRFFGFQRQPNVRTVESELFSALEKIGAQMDSYQAAGRTDKGVSALGMVVVFNMDGEFRIGDLNDKLPDDVRAWAFAKVNNLKCRYAKERWYRYVAPKFQNPELVMKGCELFAGEHSFHNFSKKDDSADRNPVRKVLETKLIEREFYDIIDVKGESFLWQMVRRMVCALCYLDRGALSLQEFSDLLCPEVITSIEPAPPDGLTLMDTVYEGVKFEEDLRWKDYISDYARKKTLSFYSSLEISNFLSIT